MSVTRNACRGLRALGVVQLLYARAAQDSLFNSESSLTHEPFHIHWCIIGPLPIGQIKFGM